MTQKDPDARNAEALRLSEDSRREKNWKRWGPYLSERQWGTVREDRFDLLQRHSIRDALRPHEPRPNAIATVPAG